MSPHKGRKRPKTMRRRREGKNFAEATERLPRVPVDEPLPLGEPEPHRSNGTNVPKKRRRGLS